MSILEAACDDREAKLYTVGKEIKVTERDFSEDVQRFDVRTPWAGYYDLELHLRGAHQLQNAAQAIGLAKALGDKTRLSVSEDAVKQGVLDARWAGRLEKVGDRPRIVLDGAHNTDSVRKMLDGVKRHFHFSSLIVVFGSSSDKDVDGMLQGITAEADRLVLTQARHPRALPVPEILSRFEGATKKVYSENTPAEAIKKARSLASADDLILITGSLYLVAEARLELFGGQPF